MRGTKKQFWIVLIQNITAFLFCALVVFFAGCRREKIPLEVKIQQILDRATSPEWIEQRVWLFSWKPRESYSQYHDYPSEKLGLKKWEEVKIDTNDGLVLDCWFIPLQDDTTTPKGTLIVLHGSQTDMRGVLKDNLYLLNHGYQMFLFNSRENIPQRGKCFLREDLDDIGLILGYLKERKDVDAERIGIMGFSWGALKAVLAGSRYHALKSVVADSGPVSFHDFGRYCMVSRDRDKKIAEVRKNDPDYVEAYIAMIDSPDHMDTLIQVHKMVMEELLGYSIDEYDAEKQASNISPRALLVIHGELDKRVQMNSSKRVYEAARAPKEFFISPKSEHIKGMHQAPDVYIPKVINFLENYNN